MKIYLKSTCNHTDKHALRGGGYEFLEGCSHGLPKRRVGRVGRGERTEERGICFLVFH